MTRGSSEQHAFVLQSQFAAQRVNRHRVSNPALQTRFFLLGASYTTGNCGVAALASGTVNSVKHTFPDARIFLLDYGRKPRAHYVRCSEGAVEVELVNLRFSWKIWLRNNIARLLITALGIRLVPLRPVRTRLIAHNPYLSRIQGATIVASIAGGDSFSDIYGLGRLLYVALPQVLVILLGKPLVLLPQTLGPFKGALSKIIAKWIIHRAKSVFARDSESLVDMRSIVGSDVPSLRQSYDMAFAMEPFPPSEERQATLRKLEGHRPIVGFNVSGLLYMGGYSKDNMFRLKADYRELVFTIIRCFFNLNANILLIPHVFGPDSESDTTACGEIYDKMKNVCGEQLHLLEGHYDQHEIKFIIGKCDFFLGSRMHACIGGLSQCVPAIGLAYSRKFEGVWRSVGMQDLVVDLRDYDSEEVIKRILSAYEARQRTRERLEKTMPDVYQEVLSLFSKLDWTPRT